MSQKKTGKVLTSGKDIKAQQFTVRSLLIPALFVVLLPARQAIRGRGGAAHDRLVTTVCHGANSCKSHARARDVLCLRNANST